MLSSIQFETDLTLDCVELVVHVGAGSGAVLDSYENVRARRIVLIEGDPSHADLLRKALSFSQLPVEVCECVVAPSEVNRLLWRHTNWPALNGPIDPLRLAQYYPRLEVYSQSTLEARSLDSLIEQFLPAGSLPDSALLVLDVPGQELEILRATDPAILRRFTHLAVVGCGLTLDGDPRPSLDSAIDLLKAQHWVHIQSTRQKKWLWDRATFRFEPLRHAEAAATQRAHDLERKLAEAFSQRDVQLAHWKVIESDWHTRDAEMLRKVEAAHQRETGLRHAFEIERRDWSALKTSMQQLIDSQVEQLAQSDHQLQQEIESLAKVQMEVAELHQELSALREAGDQGRYLIAKLQNQVVRWSGSADAAVAEVKTLTHRLAAVEAERDQARQEYEGQLVKTVALGAMIRHLRDERQALHKMYQRQSVGSLEADSHEEVSAYVDSELTWERHSETLSAHKTLEKAEAQLRVVKGLILR